MRAEFRKSRLQAYAGIVAAFAVSACMGPLGEVLAKQEAERQSLAQQTAARLIAGRPCCTSYREMRFRPLSFGKEREIVLSETSSIFAFPFGRTRFEAIELPPLEVGDTLSIKAVELISGPDAKPIFRPTLVLLDDAFRPIDPSPTLSLKEHFSGWSIEGHEETIAIGTDYVRARYAIVAADPAYSGQYYVRGAHTNTIPAGGSIYVTTSSPKKLYPYGFEGRAFITVAHRGG